MSNTSPGRLPLRALIYNRVSSDPTRRRVSVDSQDVENQAWCDREGIEVAASISDNDRSASRAAVKQREGYLQVRRALAGNLYGRIDFLVVWESSRAERTLDGHVELRNLCVTHNVRLVYKGRIFDMSSGDDRFTTGIDALVDEREAERIRERVLRGHRRSAAEGRPRSGVPYGYRRLYDEKSGFLRDQVPDPVTAPIVQEIVARVLAGETLYSIVVDLNQRGVPTPNGRKTGTVGTWQSATIRSLLRSRSMTGVRTHKGTVHAEATWEPIVSTTDWLRAQRVLADPVRARHHRGVAVKYLMSGIATCGVCGAWCRPASNRGYPSYMCAGYGPGSTGGKGHVTIRRVPLDTMVENLVIGYVSRPDVAALLSAPEPDDSGASKALAELAELRARLDAFIESAGSPGGISPMALAEVEARLRPQIADAEQRAAPRALPVPIAAMVAGDPRQVWEDDLDMSQQRQVVRFLMEIKISKSARGLGARGFEPGRVNVRWLVGPGTSGGADAAGGADG